MKKVFVLINEQIALNASKYLSTLPTDGSMEVEFREKKVTKSDKQNAALWSVAYPPIMEAMGLRGEKERLYIHEFFCGEYFGWNKKAIMGKVKQIPKRTTTRNEEGKRDLLEMKYMADLYGFIQQRAAEYGIFVPDPDPMYGICRGQ